MNGKDGIEIRVARPDDAKKLLEIYRPYVEKTAITFEYDVPDVKEFRRRIEHTLEKYPYLLAQKQGEILGYVYTGPFVGRAAYDWAAELSIYLKMDCRRREIGRKLYEAVENIAAAQHITNLCACIGTVDAEDEYLNNNSARFHAHMGYRMVGEFRKCGYKFGRWYNMVWMEKIIGDHAAFPEPVTPFGKLEPEVLKKAGVKLR